MHNTISIIGECMIELSKNPTGVQYGFGGDTLNTAIYLSRLLNKEPFSIHYVSALGTDEFSHDMLQSWQKEDIKTNFVQQLDNKLPGLYAITTNEQGERSFSYWRNDAAARYWLKTPQSDAICQEIARSNYIYLSGISLAILDAESLISLIALLKLQKKQGGKVIFDNNYRPRLWNSKTFTQKVYSEILELTDIALLTIDDEFDLWGDTSYKTVIERTQALGVSEIVIKRGSESCLIATNDELFEIPAQKIAKEKVIDTTAAGDSFGAGYIAGRLMNLSPVDSAAQGHLLASTVIQYRGAIIPKDKMPK